MSVVTDNTAKRVACFLTGVQLTACHHKLVVDGFPIQLSKQPLSGSGGPSKSLMLGMIGASAWLMGAILIRPS